MQVILTAHNVEIFTANYHLSGELHMRGAPGIFLNDALYPVFTLVGGVIHPLAQGTQIGAMNVTRFYVPKQSIEVVGLPEIDMAEVQLMSSTRRLIVFTETYVVRGDFHTGPETASGDVFHVTSGPFFPATNVEIHAVRPTPTDVRRKMPLVYVYRDAVQVLYSQDEQAG